MRLDLFVITVDIIETSQARPWDKDTDSHNIELACHGKVLFNRNVSKI